MYEVLIDRVDIDENIEREVIEVETKRKAIGLAVEEMKWESGYYAAVIHQGRVVFTKKGEFI